MSFLIAVGTILIVLIMLAALVLAIPPVRNGLHAYIYGRWTDKYVAFLRNKWGPQTHGLGRGWLANRYHGKVLTPEQAAAIVSLDHDIAEQEIEQIIPYPLARKILLNGPPDITVYECACRASKAVHCEPSQVCMVIGQPYADFVLKHHPGKSRRLNQNEALKLLEDEHKRGHLHSAWFKDAMGGRFYCICNCCSCCCGGIEAMTEYGSPLMVSSGFVAKIDSTVCAACGKCETACPFNAISGCSTAHETKQRDFKQAGGYVVDTDRCMGCEVCETACAKNAISFARDYSKPEPLDVRLLH